MTMNISIKYDWLSTNWYTDPELRTMFCEKNVRTLTGLYNENGYLHLAYICKYFGIICPKEMATITFIKDENRYLWIDYEVFNDFVNVLIRYE